MHHNTFSYTFVALVAFVAAGLGAATPVEKPSVVKPFKVNLSSEVPRMLKLVKESKLPDKPEYPGVGSSFGIDLDVLKDLKKQWLEDFNWEKEQDAINKYTRPQSNISTHHLQKRKETDFPNADSSISLQRLRT